MMRSSFNQKHQLNNSITNVMLASFIAPCDYSEGKDGWTTVERFHANTTTKLSQAIQVQPNEGYIKIDGKV